MLVSKLALGIACSLATVRNTAKRPLLSSLRTAHRSGLYHNRSNTIGTMATQSAASHAVEGEHKYTNRLAKEQSPYLLQHAHNPVDWYPWSDEAFEAAKQQSKPIFLSVGYATCHWCHVMEHESFESEEAAAIMNKHFINIKVDREERPDVDRVYMTFVQAMTGHGGWPMSVWLTPDLKPFYGGTYYPGKDSYGMPSFATVLRKIATLWATKQTDLESQASDILQQLQDFTSSLPPSPSAEGAAAPVEPRRLLNAIHGCAKQLAKGFDAKLGGFGGPPKFPRPSEINLLLRAATEQASQEASSGTSKSGKSATASPSAELLVTMSLFTLQAMAAGGMYDQIGGGFHRYSVDEYWHVPHFEKMLYDNPQLALTYLDAFRITLAAQRSSSSNPSSAAADDAGLGLLSPAGAAVEAPAGPGDRGSSSSSNWGLRVGDERLSDPRVYATVVRGVLDYLRRDMTHPEGGLYSAEDADSLDPAVGRKLEGAFYVWAAAEIQEVLGADSAGIFNEVYGVKPQGNCTLSPRSDPHGEFKGKNVLMQFKPLDAAASVKLAGLPLQRVVEMMGQARQHLHERRATRPRPALDDKIVTAWNGQGISAFAQAARVLAAEQPPAAACFPVEGCPPSTYLAAAIRVAEFLQQHVWDEGTKRLKRAYCKAPSAVEGFADDYALLIAGLLDLYEAGGGLHWLTWAVQLQDTLDTLFWDSNSGGFFQSSGTDPSIKLRMKEDYDGAEPAASSIAAGNLIRLAALLPHGGSPSLEGKQQQQMSYSARADGTLAAFTSRLDQVPIAMPQMCAAAWLRTRTPLRQVIIAGAINNPKTQALLDAAAASWAPDKALILIDPANPESVGFWRKGNPEAWNMVESHFSNTGSAAAAAAVGGQQAEVAASEVAAAGGADAANFEPTAFVCQNFTCQAPTQSPGRLYELLSNVKPAGVKLQPVQL